MKNNIYITKAIIFVLITALLWSNIAWALPQPAGNARTDCLSAESQFNREGFSEVLVTLGRILSRLRTSSGKGPLSDYTRLLKSLADGSIDKGAQTMLNALLKIPIDYNFRSFMQQGGARKSIFDSSPVLEEKEVSILYQHANKDGKLREFRYKGKRRFSYRVIPFAEDDPIGKVLAAKKMDTYNLPAGKGTYFIFAKKGLVINELKHERLEIYWFKELQRLQGKKKLKRLPIGFDISRAAHVLAWAQQILDEGWTKVENSAFIREQLEGDEVTVDDLMRLIIEGRTRQHELISEHLGIDNLRNIIVPFEESVRKYAEKILRGKESTGTPVLETDLAAVEEMIADGDLDVAGKMLEELEGKLNLAEMANMLGRREIDDDKLSELQRKRRDLAMNLSSVKAQNSAKEDTRSDPVGYVIKRLLSNGPESKQFVKAVLRDLGIGDLGLLLFVLESSGDWVDDVDKAEALFSSNSVRAEALDVFMLRSGMPQKMKDDIKGMLINLAGNLGHIGKGKRMVLSLRVKTILERNWLEIKATDNGRGFPESVKIRDILWGYGGLTDIADEVLGRSSFNCLSVETTYADCKGLQRSERFRWVGVNDVRNAAEMQPQIRPVVEFEQGSTITIDYALFPEGDRYLVDFIQDFKLKNGRLPAMDEMTLYLGIKKDVLIERMKELKSADRISPETYSLFVEVRNADLPAYTGLGSASIHKARDGAKRIIEESI